MDKELLIRVLSSSNRVIMPGFGVFLRKNLNEQLIFSPFLRNDDGYLVSVVEQEYGLSKEDATDMVLSFIEHIKMVLVEKKRFIIDGVGTLFVDENGAIAMVMDTSKQISDAATSVSVEQPQSQSEVAAETVVEEAVSEPVVEQVVDTPVSEPVAEEVVSEPIPVVVPQIPRPVQQPPIPQQAQQGRVVGTNQSMMGGATRMNQGVHSMAPKPLQPTAQPYTQQRQSAPTPKQQPMSSQSVYSRPMQSSGGMVKPRVQSSGQQNAQQQQSIGGLNRPNQYGRGIYTPQSQQQQPQAQPQQHVEPAQSIEQQKPQQPQQRPVPQQQNRRGTPKKKSKQSKTDIWLTVAIIAAMVVIGLMVFGILTAQESDLLL